MSQRARTAYEKSEGETRLEPMVLNRNLPLHRNQSLNLIRPDSIVDSVCIFNEFLSRIFRLLFLKEPTPKSLNELNQLLDTLSKAKENLRKEIKGKFE